MDWTFSLASQTFFVGGACGKGKRTRSTFRNDFAKILAKPHPNCHVVCVKLPPIINGLARGEDGRRHAWGRLPSMYYKKREEQNLAVQGEIEALYVRVCMTGRDKVRDFPEYFKFHENSEY